jgi:ABC-2 type transport system permease protein
MTGLVGVEGRRFRSRTAVRWIAVLAVAAALLVVAGAWSSTRPASAATQAQAEEQYRLSVEDWERNGETYQQDCLDGEAAAREDDPQVDWGCDSMEPQLDQFLPYRAELATSITSWLSAVAQFLLLLALGAGVTAVTAELGSGSMALWLTFVPRRGRVYASKIAAPVLGVLAPAAVVVVLACGGAYGATALNDQVGAMTGEAWADLGWQGLRVVALAGLVAGVGAALGFVLRSAAAALGVVVGWLVLVDSVVLGGFVPSLARWRLLVQVQAWLEGGAEIYVTVPCTDLVGADAPPGGLCSAPVTITQMQGGLLLVAVAVVLVAVGWFAFRRRDLD